MLEVNCPKAAILWKSLCHIESSHVDAPDSSSSPSVSQLRHHTWEWRCLEMIPGTQSLNVPSWDLRNHGTDKSSTKGLSEFLTFRILGHNKIVVVLGWFSGQQQVTGITDTCPPPPPFLGMWRIVAPSVSHGNHQCNGNMNSGSPVWPPLLSTVAPFISTLTAKWSPFSTQSRERE